MKILTLEEMMDAAVEEKMPELKQEIRLIEVAAQLFADKLADHLKVRAGFVSYEYGLGGLAATFRPTTKKQRCPKVIDEKDKGGDWE
jgi:hypothetical protein